MRHEKSFYMLMHHQKLKNIYSEGLNSQIIFLLVKSVITSACNVGVEVLDGVLYRKLSNVKRSALQLICFQALKY